LRFATDRSSPARITKVYRFEGVVKVPTETASTGEIVAVAGMEEVTVPVVTFTDPLQAESPAAHRSSIPPPDHFHEFSSQRLSLSHGTEGRFRHVASFCRTGLNREILFRRLRSRLERFPM